MLALLLSLACAEPARGDRIEPFAGWLQARTEHFVFIYEPRDEPSVAELVGFAEDVYDKVTGRFGTRPRQVPVVVRGRTDTANGFYTALPHRIELFVTSPSGPWLGARGEGWLRLLLTHELSHYVHFAARVGVFGGLSRVFGHDLTALDFFFMPGWFVEGITTHNETIFSEGGRGRNPFFEMLYKAPVLEGRFWELKKAAYASSFAPRERIYVSGWLLTDTISRRFGEDAYARIHRAFARAPLLGVDHAVKKVTGVPAKRLYAEMKSELEARFASDAALPQGRLLSPQRPGDWYLPRVSRAGWFAYSWSHDRAPGIYRVSPEQWDGEPVFAGLLTDESSFDVSAEGCRLVAARPVPDPADPAGYSAFSDLWLLDLEGRVERRLTVGRRLWHPALSPDGSRIVAVERADSYSRLVEVDPASGAVRPLYEPQRTTVYGPRFDERGERIVFVENVRGLQDVMLLDSGRVRPLFGRDLAGDYYPAFSGPHSVLFSSDREGGLALYEYDLAQGVLYRVVRDRVAAWAGVRAGGELLYASYASDGFCVRQAPAAAQAAAIALPQAAEPGPASAAAPVEGLPYRDLPRPLVWFPYVGASGSLETGLDFPMGLGLYGAGILQRGLFSVSAAWNPHREQPELLASYTWNPGPAALTAEAGQSFRETSDGWQQQLAASLALAVPVWSRAAPGAEASLEATVAAGIASTTEAPEPFSFDEGLDREAERKLVLGASGELSLFAQAPPRALYGRAGLEAAAGVKVTPPALDRDEAETEVSADVRGQAPAPGRFAAVSLQVRGVLSSSGSVADLLPPRGGASWEPGDGDAKLLASLDWRQPFGLFDGRALGVSLLAAGGILYAEAGAYVDADGSARLLDDLTFGLELDASLLLLNVRAAAAAGVAVRVDRRFEEPVDGRDLHLYLSVMPSIGPGAGPLRRGAQARSLAPSFDTSASWTRRTSSSRGVTRL